MLISQPPLVHGEHLLVLQPLPAPVRCPAVSGESSPPWVQTSHSKVGVIHKSVDISRIAILPHKMLLGYVMDWVLQWSLLFKLLLFFIIWKRGNGPETSLYPIKCPPIGVTGDRMWQHFTPLMRINYRTPQIARSVRLSSRHIVPKFENTLKMAGMFRKGNLGP